MRTALNLTVLTASVAIFTSCASTQMRNTGFLSDYSKLQKQSGSSLRYVDKAALKGYPSIMVDPVSTRLGASGKDLSSKQISDLKSYTHAKVADAVRASGRKVVMQPGPGVARLRIALTDLSDSSALNTLPQAAILGVGAGGASMEAEIVDSVTGVQIGAIVESGSGSRIPFANLGDMGACKGVINGWAKRLEQRLSE